MHTGNFNTIHLHIQSDKEIIHADKLKDRVIHLQTELDYAALGRKIKEMRIAKGLTQSDLADMVFCNTSHISNIENNHTKVSLNSLLAIANALNTSIDCLLSEQFENASTALDNDIARRLRNLDPEKKRQAIRIMDVL